MAEGVLGGAGLGGSAVTAKGGGLGGGGGKGSGGGGEWCGERYGSERGGERAGVLPEFFLSFLVP